MKIHLLLDIHVKKDPNKVLNMYVSLVFFNWIGNQ